jgi:hypothetical protein
MPSETRRLANLLVERRSETFASRYPREDSIRRVEQALHGFVPKGMEFETSWRDDNGASQLDVRFAPARRTRRFLNIASAVMALLLLGSLYALVAPDATSGQRIPIVVVTMVAILIFPLVVVAYGSRREAEESTLRRRIRKAIVEAED